MGFYLITKKTKWFGNPWVSGHGESLAPKINRAFDSFMWHSGLAKFISAIDRFRSVRRYGEFLCSARNFRSYNWPGKDYWRKQGRDRCCSYCGSWHPDQFKEFLHEVINNPSDLIRVEVADGRHKIYANRPHVINAHFGAIKFYMRHAPRGSDGSDLFDKDFIALLNQAVEVSYKKWHKYISRWERGLASKHGD